MPSTTTAATAITMMLVAFMMAISFRARSQLEEQAVSPRQREVEAGPRKNEPMMTSTAQNMR